MFIGTVFMLCIEMARLQSQRQPAPTRKDPDAAKETVKPVEQAKVLPV